MNTRKKMGEILVAAGVVSETTIQDALALQKVSGKKLGHILAEMGQLSEQDLAVVLARQFGLKIVKNLATHAFPSDILNLVPGSLALEKHIFPLKREQNSLYVATANPLDIATLDSLSFRIGLRVIPCVATQSDINAAIRAHYFQGESSQTQDHWKILVVDSQDFSRALAKTTLGRDGFEVLEACNCAEALQQARRHSPDLILLDTVVPRLDGLDAFRALKDCSSTREIPVITVTSRATAEEEAFMLQAGVFDFLAKPINPIRLSARVKRAFALTYGPGWTQGRQSWSRQTQQNSLPVTTH